MGALACVHLIPDQDLWETLTMRAPAVDQLRTTKYLLPVDPVPEMTPLFLNLNVVTLHYDLMSQGFPDVFPGLTRLDYIGLVTDGPERPYLAGNLTQYIDKDSAFFGFVVWDDPARDDATLTQTQAQLAYDTLSQRFDLAPLTFVPSTEAQRLAAASWNVNFPIRGVDSDITYEPYTIGVGYGTIRLFDSAAFAEATEQAAFGYQDLLVLDEAPFDVERVISGAVTGTRQGQLSHLNVRSAARGTPNCFVADPLTALSQWEGQLVRLECAEDDWSVSPATVSEAEAWWDALRPDPVTLPTPDLNTTDFAPLLSLDTSTAEARREATSRYGSKGTNLATLYQRIPTDFQLDGFLVPFSGYHDFIETQGWTVDLGEGPVEANFADTVAVWLQDDDFLNDGLIRRTKLESLRTAIKAAPHDPLLLTRLGEAIVDTFGDTTTMVRFRSSSNAEDSLTFSGAGLYDSTSVCLADELDGDDLGPSLCDPDQPKERSLSRALGKVWASMWKMEAFEERAWYGMDHSEAVMGVLVNTRSADEQANIVAFTGNPSADDDRTLVNAQIGTLDVVSSEPGVFPEKSLLEVSGETVTEIVRVTHSSERPSSWVLSDTQLQELGGLLGQIEASYPMDEAVPVNSTVLLDSEWKVLSDGRLVIKQIRPFLRVGL
jgi:pyruvate,water dikinase